MPSQPLTADAWPAEEGAQAAPSPALIGPNAIIQTLAAVREACGEADAMALAKAAGCAAWAHTPPEAMVEEGAVIALFRALRARHPDRAQDLFRQSGLRTAEYVLAHRIPRPVRFLLTVLPARLAAGPLARAIAAHAWTFAGSGVVGVRCGPGRRCIFEIARNPLAVGPVCVWHEAVFERLFARLVHPNAAAREISCRGGGGPVCRIEVTWPGR